MTKMTKLMESASAILNRGSMLSESKNGGVVALAENLAAGASNIIPSKLKHPNVAQFERKLRDLNVWMNANLIDTEIIV